MSRPKLKQIEQSGAGDREIVLWDDSAGQWSPSVIRHYANSTTDPTSPTPAVGDRYYNTTLEMEMRFDGSRSKFLSVESSVIGFGKTGNTGAGSYFRGPGDFNFSSVRGRHAEFSGTVVSIGYIRSDTDAATFVITADGSSIATLASSAIKGGSTTLNANFSQAQILAVQNETGGNTMSNVMGWVRLKWRP